MSNELLEKVIVSTEIGAPAGSGLLAPAQASEFIDYMWDATVLAPQVRTVTLSSTEQEFDRIGVGQRLIRKAVEAVDTGENQGVFFSKINLRTTKIRLDWELSTETLEDNLEGEALEDHIARMMATQAGTDLEDVAINGDEDSTDRSLSIMDGWRKRALEGTVDGAAHVIDHGGQPFNRLAAHRALKAMPRKFMQQRGNLRFWAPASLLQDYNYGLTEDGLYPELGQRVIQNGGNVATGRAGGFTVGNLFGVPAQEVNLFRDDLDGDYSGSTGGHGELWLTDPKNLLWGVKREIKVTRAYAHKKDTLEYTMFCRVGTQIENTDAFVIVKNIALGD